jgi:hypothetical protein
MTSLLVIIQIIKFKKHIVNKIKNLNGKSKTFQSSKIPENISLRELNRTLSTGCMKIMLSRPSWFWVPKSGKPTAFTS